MGKFAEKTDVERVDKRLTVFICNDFRHLSNKVHYLLGGMAVIIVLAGATVIKLWT